MRRKTASMVSQATDRAAPLGTDADFALVIAACLVVHVALIALLLNTWDELAEHPFLFVAGAQVGFVLLARYIGRVLHAASSQLSTVPRSAETTTA